MAKLDNDEFNRLLQARQTVKGIIKFQWRSLGVTHLALDAAVRALDTAIALEREKEGWGPEQIQVSPIAMQITRLEDEVSLKNKQIEVIHGQLTRAEESIGDFQRQCDALQKMVDNFGDVLLPERNRGYAMAMKDAERECREMYRSIPVPATQVESHELSLIQIKDGRLTGVDALRKHIQGTTARIIAHRLREMGDNAADLLAKRNEEAIGTLLQARSWQRTSVATDAFHAQLFVKSLSNHLGQLLGVPE